MVCRRSERSVRAETDVACSKYDEESFSKYPSSHRGAFGSREVSADSPLGRSVDSKYLTSSSCQMAGQLKSLSLSKFVTC